MTMQTRKTAEIRELWPLLTVGEMARSLAFYRETLGFEFADKAESSGRIFWCRLKRGGSSLMLQQAEAEDGPMENLGRDLCLYFLCDDALHAELAGRGLTLPPPQTAYYGMRQVYLTDPDAYQLCFESIVQSWRAMVHRAHVQAAPISQSQLVVLRVFESSC
jgi:glyoxylase I family protein